MNRSILIVVFVSIFACSPSKKSNQTNKATSINVDNSNTQQDGSSFEKAIVIQEKSENAGVAAEYKWMKENYPGYKMQKQTLRPNKGKNYDVLSVVLVDGSKRDFYFDVSNFLGKF